MNGLFIFRRDLRTTDNTGLIELCKKCSSVYCIFILDDRQITNQNKYFTLAGFKFMLESLIDLKKSINVAILHGEPTKLIAKLIKQLNISVVYANADYTPFALQRDKEITEVIEQFNRQKINSDDKKTNNSSDKEINNINKDNEKQNINSNIEIKFWHDSYLNSPLDIKPYKVFTPYYVVASKIKVKRPMKCNVKSIKKINKLNTVKELTTCDLSDMLDDCYKRLKRDGYDIDLMIKGGRTNGLKRMTVYNTTSTTNERRTYKDRDQFSYQTSMLSAHIKFGTISIREVYYKYKNTMFRRELYWRDFYMQIAYHFPHVFGQNFKNVKGLKTKWIYNKQLFEKWCEGKTGIDIIDACMHQLNLTGYMHNRGRMVVANYLTRVLKIDWRLGEQYFASKLIDYDPCSNNGGWQWSAGTGAEYMFRVFNPELQAKRFDHDGEYRKKWL